MKAFILSLLLALCLASTGRAQIFTQSNASLTTQAALTIAQMCNQEFAHKLLIRRLLWDALWMNPAADPIAISQAMEAQQPGSLGLLVSASLQEAATLQSQATALNTTVTAIIGAQNLQYLSPPAAYTLNASGNTYTITLTAGWVRAVTAGKVTLTSPDGNTVIKP